MGFCEGMNIACKYTALESKPQGAKLESHLPNKPASGAQVGQSD